MTILNQNDCIIVIVDIQEKLLNAVFNKEIVEKNAAITAKASNILDIPVIVTEQYPKGLGSTVESLNSLLKFNVPHIEKVTFSCMDTPVFSECIKKYSKKQIILLGIETHICVSQTAAALIMAGHDVNVLSDASGSHYKEQHEAGLERIKDNGGHVCTTEIALFELLKSSRHPNFKEVQALIK